MIEFEAGKFATTKLNSNHVGPQSLCLPRAADAVRNGDPASLAEWREWRRLLV